MVLQALSGNKWKIEFAYQYFVEGKLVAQIARENGKDRRHVQHIIEKFKTEGCTSQTVRYILSKLYDKILELEPVAIPINEEYVRCKLCGNTFYRYGFWRHLEWRHCDYVYTIVDRLRRML